ncbi:MAG: ACT domain-containing protein [Eubacteriaceae bacterium]|jgi:aspartokinase|nr:ACT domain-containing protein [Eubacteriaceae bacterium]
MINLENHTVDGMIIDEEKMMITIKNVRASSRVLTDFLKLIRDAEINIDVISQTAPIDNHIDIAFIVLADQIEVVEGVFNKLKERHADIVTTINDQITCLAITGIGMRSQSGVASNFFNTLTENNIPILMITTSEIRVTCVVNKEDGYKGSMAMKNAFAL